MFGVFAFILSSSFSATFASFVARAYFSCVVNKLPKLSFCLEVAAIRVVILAVCCSISLLYSNPVLKIAL